MLSKKVEKLKENISLIHAKLMMGETVKKDVGSISVEWVVFALGGLIIGSFIVFGFLGITKDQIMTGISSTFSSFFGNITTK